MLYLFLQTIASLALILAGAVLLGRIARWIKLPTITGFLITGMIVGPFILGVLSHEELSSLKLLDHSALGFIALLAGSELEVKTLKSKFKSILGVMFGLVTVTATIGAVALYSLGDWLPFLRDEPNVVRWAAAVLAGVIMTARSPSAAIAVIGETKAQGPFTQLILGVTVLMDAVVIILFAIAMSSAHSLVDEKPLSLLFLGEISMKLTASGALGLLLGRALTAIFSLKYSLFRIFRTQWLLLCPLLAMLAAEHMGHLSLFGLAVHIEPLLTCLVIGVTLNLAPDETCHAMEVEFNRCSPAVYLIFFTLTGASLALDQLSIIWPAAAMIFFVRLVGIIGGSTLGGVISGEPSHQHRIRWMGFVTQAGVGLGLSQRVAIEFPTWGIGFATMMTAVIVLNESVGPIFFRRALILSGESQSQADDPLLEAELKPFEGPS